MDAPTIIQARKSIAYTVEISGTSVPILDGEKYIAMDGTGSYYAYTEKPDMYQTSWTLNIGSWRSLMIKVSAAEATQWEHSLRKIVFMK